MYILAKIRSVKDRQTDRTDDSMPTVDQYDRLKRIVITI